MNYEFRRRDREIFRQATGGTMRRARVNRPEQAC
jgi:hypothetical protein